MFLSFPPRVFDLTKRLVRRDFARFGIRDRVLDAVEQTLHDILDEEAASKPNGTIAGALWITTQSEGTLGSKETRIGRGARHQLRSPVSAYSVQ